MRVLIGVNFNKWFSRLCLNTGFTWPGFIGLKLNFLRERHFIRIVLSLMSMIFTRRYVSRDINATLEIPGHKILDQTNYSFQVNKWR